MDAWPSALIICGVLILSLIGILLVMLHSRRRRNRARSRRPPDPHLDRWILATHKRLELPSGRVVCSQYHDGVRQRWPCPVAAAAQAREAARDH